MTTLKDLIRDDIQHGLLEVDMTGKIKDDLLEQIMLTIKDYFEKSTN